MCSPRPATRCLDVNRKLQSLERGLPEDRRVRDASQPSRCPSLRVDIWFAYAWQKPLPPTLHPNSSDGLRAQGFLILSAVFVGQAVLLIVLVTMIIMI